MQNTMRKTSMFLYVLGESKECQISLNYENMVRDAIIV